MPRRPVTSLNVTPIRHDAWVTWHDDAVSALTTDLKAAIALVRDLDHDTLVHLAEAVRDEQRDRALKSGDQDAIISRAFDIGFGADGLAAAPWIDEPFLVCPGAMAAKSKTNYRSRFINLDDCWVWESAELVREDKRSNPGNDEGFRAVALVPIIEGMEVDQVSGRQRSGQYEATKIVSYEVRGGDLVEVSQRDLSAKRAPRR